MKRQFIYLACALLICGLSPVARSQSGVQEAGPTEVKKKPDRRLTKKSPPNKTVLPDLSVSAGQSFCYRDYAGVDIKRVGGTLPNPFSVSLKIYRGATLLESFEKVIEPFSDGGQRVSFAPQTQLIRMKTSDPPLYCKFTVDALNQVREIRENNNTSQSNVPAEDAYSGPHD
jgi:hypothetical protein